MQGPKRLFSKASGLGSTSKSSFKNLDSIQEEKSTKGWLQAKGRRTLSILLGEDEGKEISNAVAGGRASKSDGSRKKGITTSGSSDKKTKKNKDAPHKGRNTRLGVPQPGSSPSYNQRTSRHSFFGVHKSHHKNFIDVLNEGLTGKAEFLYTSGLANDNMMDNEDDNSDNEDATAAELNENQNDAKRRARLLKRRVLDLTVLIKHGAIVWAARKRREMEIIAKKLDEADEKLRMQEDKEAAKNVDKNSHNDDGDNHDNVTSEIPNPNCITVNDGSTKCIAESNNIVEAQDGILQNEKGLELRPANEEKNPQRVLSLNPPSDHLSKQKKSQLLSPLKSSRSSHIEDIQNMMGFGNTKSLACGVGSLTTLSMSSSSNPMRNDSDSQFHTAMNIFGHGGTNNQTHGDSDRPGKRPKSQSDGANDGTKSGAFRTLVSHYVNPSSDHMSINNRKMKINSSSNASLITRIHRFFSPPPSSSNDPPHNTISLSHISRSEFLANIRIVSLLLFCICLLVSAAVSFLLSQIVHNTDGKGAYGVCTGNNGGRTRFGLDNLWLDDLRKEMWRRTQAEKENGRKDTDERSIYYWDAWVKDAEKKWREWDNSSVGVEINKRNMEDAGWTQWERTVPSSSSTVTPRLYKSSSVLLDEYQPLANGKSVDFPGFPADPVAHFLHYHIDKTIIDDHLLIPTKINLIVSREFNKAGKKDSTSANLPGNKYLRQMKSDANFQTLCTSFSDEVDSFGNLSPLLWTGDGTAESVFTEGVYFKLLFYTVLNRLGLFIWIACFWYIALVDERRKAELRWLDEIDNTWWIQDRTNNKNRELNTKSGNQNHIQIQQQVKSSSNSQSDSSSSFSDSDRFFRIVKLCTVALVLGSLSLEDKLKRHVMETKGREEWDNKFYWEFLDKIISHLTNIFVYAWPFVFLDGRFRAEFFAQFGLHFTWSKTKFNPLTACRIGYPEAVDIEDSFGRPWFRILPSCFIFYEYLHYIMPPEFMHLILPKDVYTQIDVALICTMGAYLASTERSLLRRKERRRLRELGLLGGGVLIKDNITGCRHQLGSNTNNNMMVLKIVSASDSMMLSKMKKEKNQSNVKEKELGFGDKTEPVTVEPLCGNLISLFWYALLLYNFQEGSAIRFYREDLIGGAVLTPIERLMFWHFYSIFVLCLATAFGQCLFLRFKHASTTVLFVWPFHLFFSVGGTFQIFRMSPLEGEFWLGLFMVISMETYRDSGFWVHINRAWRLYYSGKKKIKKISRDFIIKRTRSGSSSSILRVFSKESVKEGRNQTLSDIVKNLPPETDSGESQSDVEGRNEKKPATLKSKLTTSLAKVFPVSNATKKSVTRSNTNENNIFDPPDYDPDVDERDPFSDLAEIFYWNIQSGLAEKSAQVLALLFAIAELIMSVILGDKYVPYLLPTDYIDTLDPNSVHFDPQARRERAQNFPWEDYENGRKVKMEYYSDAMKNSFSSFVNEDGKPAITDLQDSTNFFDLTHPLAGSPFWTSPENYYSGNNATLLRKPLSNPPRHALKSPGNLLLHFVGLFLIFFFEAVQCRFCEEWNKGMLMHSIKMEERAFRRGNKKLVKKTRRVYEDFKTNVSSTSANSQCVNGSTVKEDVSCSSSSNSENDEASFEAEDESIIKAALVEAVRQHFSEYKLFFVSSTLYASYLIFLYGPMLWGWTLQTWLPNPVY